MPGVGETFSNPFTESRVAKHPVTTLDYLTEYAFAREALIAGVFVATAAALLSTVVVLKRLAFVGQGISHSAFAGIGLAVLIGLSGIWSEVLILASCFAAAMVIGSMGRVRGGGDDTAIGIVLAGAMGLGFLLLSLRQPLRRYEWYEQWLAAMDAPAPIGLESILFGSLMTVGPEGVGLSIVLAGVIVAALWWWRRPMLLYVFDETVARSAGVPVARLRLLLLLMLAGVVAVGMKLAGVVLISALLVIPGAIGLQFCRRLGPTLLVSWAAAMAGVTGGIVLSLELEQFKLTPGATIVIVLIALYALAAWFGRYTSGRGQSPHG